MASQRRGQQRSSDRTRGDDVALDEHGREEVLVAKGVVKGDMTVACVHSRGSVSALLSGAHQSDFGRLTAQQAPKADGICTQAFKIAPTTFPVRSGRRLGCRLEVAFGVEHLQAEEDEVEHAG